MSFPLYLGSGVVDASMLGCLMEGRDSARVGQAEDNLPVDLPRTPTADDLSIDTFAGIQASPEVLTESIPVLQQTIVTPPDCKAELIGVSHVFWDIENCAVPTGLHPSTVVQHIRRLHTSRGYSPSRVVAAHSRRPMSNSVIEALKDAGVDVVESASSKRSAADMLLLEEVQRFTLLHSAASSGLIFITSDVPIPKYRAVGCETLGGALIDSSVESFVVDRNCISISSRFEASCGR
ncbi:hypothetical protein CALCODRAFT_493659 [Calocera cornea HHB12733]|uniref:NYN domain-containing protein n=1 Tax=Calocera cornea HHB12733 TaxID=1353952 RepID=A0A165HHS8_9BASI|nr:hypothetical protein CALCODRAFT_493659 [Calocera cornea HHB12733]